MSNEYILCPHCHLPFYGKVTLESHVEYCTENSSSRMNRKSWENMDSFGDSAPLDVGGSTSLLFQSPFDLSSPSVGVVNCSNTEQAHINVATQAQYHPRGLDFASPPIPLAPPATHTGVAFDDGLVLRINLPTFPLPRHPGPALMSSRRECTLFPPVTFLMPGHCMRLTENLQIAVPHPVLSYPTCTKVLGGIVTVRSAAPKSGISMVPRRRLITRTKTAPPLPWRGTCGSIIVEKNLHPHHPIPLSPLFPLKANVMTLHLPRVLLRNGGHALICTSPKSC